MRGLKKIPVKRNSIAEAVKIRMVAINPNAALGVGERRSLTIKNRDTNNRTNKICHDMLMGVINDSERIISSTTPWVPTFIYFP